jgi:hypothetical protein
VVEIVTPITIGASRNDRRKDLESRIYRGWVKGWGISIGTEKTVV